MSPNQQLTPWLPILPEVGTSPRRKLNVDMREWGNDLCLDWLFKGHKREMKRKELRLISTFLRNEILYIMEHFSDMTGYLGCHSFCLETHIFKSIGYPSYTCPSAMSTLMNTSLTPDNSHLPLSNEQDYFLSASTNLFNCMIFIFYLSVFWRPLTEFLVH